LESFYFYVKIGDYESSDDVVGTGFWRPPEVLQALKDGTKPVWSREGDVYSFAMLCYELLTGCIPFKEHRLTDYDVVLSGQRPELPPYLNSKMRDLLHRCWHTEPQKRPGWITIVKSLEVEFELHRPSDRNPRLYRLLECTPKVEEPSTESCSDTEDQSVGSSTGLLASSTEFRPDIDVQSAETSSIGLLEIEGPGAGRQKILKSLHFDSVNLCDKVPVREELLASLYMLMGELLSVTRLPKVITMDREIALLLPRGMISVEGLIAFLKTHALGKLAIIWDGVGAKTVITFSEERIAFEKKRAHGKVAVIWKASTERDSLSNLAKKLIDLRMKLMVMEATIHSRFQELIIAFDAAVKQDIALECWAAQSLAASELFEAVINYVNFNWHFNDAWRRPSGAGVQAALAAWHAESPEGCEAWMETRMAASAQEAWKVAKNALQQVEKIMAEFSVFKLKLQFLVWMFLIETDLDRYTLSNECFKELVGAYPWDRISHKYCVDFESRHLLQCPRGKQIYDWWVVNRKEQMLNGEEMSDGRFVEMVGIIKKTKCKSQSLDMLVGGWKHSREDSMEMGGIIHKPKRGKDFYDVAWAEDAWGRLEARRRDMLKAMDVRIESESMELGCK
jgi:hypothetical protein